MCRSPFLRKNPFQALPAIVLFGGAERDRTADLVNAIHALSQLSYSPTSGTTINTWPLSSQEAATPPPLPPRLLHHNIVE